MILRPYAGTERAAISAIARLVVRMGTGPRAPRNLHERVVLAMFVNGVPGKQIALAFGVEAEQVREVLRTAYRFYRLPSQGGNRWRNRVGFAMVLVQKGVLVRRTLDVHVARARGCDIEWFEVA